jgi:tetratricopeptide (TPR) repeat protein
VHLVHRLEFQQGLALCDRMLARATDEGSAEWRFVGLRSRAQLYFHLGRFAEAAADSEAVIADWYAGRTQGLAALVHDPGVISVRTYYSYMLAFMGQLAEARREAEASLELGRESGHHLMVAQCRFTEAVFHDLVGDDEQALPLMQATLDYAAEHGVAYFNAICSAYVGHQLARGGAPERGLPLVSGAVQALKAAGSLVFVPGFLGRHGDVLTLGGSPEAALPLFDESLAMIGRSDARREEPFVRTWRARALARLDRTDEAELELTQALALARAQGSPLLQAFVLSEFAPRLVHTGRAQEAQAWLAECLGGFTGDPEAPIVMRIRTLLDRAGAADDHPAKELGHA